MLSLSDDFCKLVETDQSVDFEASNFSEIFVIFTIQLSDKLHVFFFTIDGDSSTHDFCDLARQFRVSQSFEIRENETKDKRDAERLDIERFFNI